MSSPSASSSGSSSSHSSSSARRGSAPASAFLAPRFWSQPQFDMPPPRRTSFGTSLAGGNGRLAALSALSMQPRSPGPSPVLAKPPPREATASAPPTPVQASQPIAQQQQQQAKPQQQPQQQQRKQNICFLPGPDGLCVESRRRRGSEA